jgi:hypothetical protein
MVWTLVGLGVALSFAILVFILQNGQRARFLMVHGTHRLARR